MLTLTQEGCQHGCMTHSNQKYNPSAVIYDLQ